MADPTPLGENLGPRVSAILVAYNQAEALRRAVGALDKSKNRGQLEILVVDCGSQDESARVDEQFPSINLLRLPHHLGATRAMNIATRTAKSDLLLFVSPNVEVGPDTVTRLADLLEPDAGIAAVCPLLVNPEGQTVSRIRGLPGRESLAGAVRGVDLPSEEPDLSQDAIPLAYPSLDALMIRKVFVRGMNYFDERFGHYWADADLAIQMEGAGKTAQLYPAVRATYHSAPDPLADDALAHADRITGAGALLGKYEGFLAGLTFRLTAAFSALGRMDLGQFSAILSGHKLDGSQAG